MKRYLIAFLIFFITSTLAVAQQERPLQRIHAAKMAYITDRLHLSSRQAADFTPIYNEFEKEIMDTRIAFFRKYKGEDPGDADDAASRQFVDDNLDYQQKVIDIRRKYNEQFLKVISAHQLSELNVAEREFKQILIKRLEKQRGRGGRFGGNRRFGY